MTIETSVSQAAQLEQQDKLAEYKANFDLPEGTIYLDGNSLGPLTRQAKYRAKQVVEEQWGNSLIASWNQHQWIDLPYTIAERLSPILGCDHREIICCDSISINLFKVLTAAIHIQYPRHLVVSTDTNFPTDLYSVQGLSQLLGESNCELVVVSPDSLESTIANRADEIAVLMLTHVDFRTGEFFDMQALTALAHKHNILIIWDLAHSAGILPLTLAEDHVDFAVGCTYKYLNGGPGAPGFVFVNHRLHAEIRQPLSGWMGHKSPFDFSLAYQPKPGIGKFLTGTPPIVSMSVLDAALTVFDTVDLHEVWEKSLRLSRFFHDCLIEFGLDSELKLLTDLAKSNRNGQLAYQHEHAFPICQALIKEGVVGDFRAPNILRLGFSPLYLSYSEILQAATTLQRISSTKAYAAAEFQVRSTVT